MLLSPYHSNGFLFQETDPKIKAAVIMSAKENDFIAGADINMFLACKVNVYIYI